MSERVTKEVKQFGNGCHVTLPKDWEGDQVVIKRVKESLHPVFDRLLTNDTDRVAIEYERESGERDVITAEVNEMVDYRGLQALSLRDPRTDEEILLVEDGESVVVCVAASRDDADEWDDAEAYRTVLAGVLDDIYKEEKRAASEARRKEKDADKQLVKTEEDKQRTERQIERVDEARKDLPEMLANKKKQQEERIAELKETRSKWKEIGNERTDTVEKVDKLRSQVADDTTKRMPLSEVDGLQAWEQKVPAIAGQVVDVFLKGR